MPGLACGSRPVSRAPGRHLAEVLQGGGAAERGELLARHAVAQLGLVAEREERLVAAGGGACAGDGEHLVGRHVAALAAPRRPGERAVVADVPAEVVSGMKTLGENVTSHRRAPRAGRLQQGGERRVEQRVHTQTLTTRP